MAGYRSPRPLTLPLEGLPLAGFTLVRGANGRDQSNLYRALGLISAFALDPEIQREWIWAGAPFHPRGLLVRRTGSVVERRGEGGRAVPIAWEISPHESLFTAVCDRSA